MEDKKQNARQRTLIRAGMLSAFRIGLVDGMARIFQSLPQKAPKEAGAERTLWETWRNARETYRQHGGDPRFLVEAMIQAGAASKFMGTFGYSGKGSLREIIGEEAYVEEVEVPMLEAGNGPDEIGVAESLAAVSGIVLAWGGLAATVFLLKDLEESGLEAVKPERNDRMAPKKGEAPAKATEGGADWKWIAGIGALLLGGYLWNTYQNEKAKWEDERQKLKLKVEDLKIELKAEKKKRKSPPIPPVWEIGDPLKDAAISNAVAILAKNRKKDWKSDLGD